MAVGPKPVAPIPPKKKGPRF
ncbi:hypothetical protein CCACVL1_17272 [Corchorus capsularis]|uniref:Uncharacterized protein n=1 Tax=Corchorus capsularis TaxID=210143 RepID=A0A1R3HSP1_COCAP|nr:hypothetical protein CCACVL1_17272 [Corchorus capsularis]